MQKKKLLLFGATGMAGHVAYFYLKATNKYDITNVVFRKKLTEDSIVLDITNKDEVQSLILEQKPDIILNCIGILIKGSKDHPDNAIYVNSYFPHLLKRLSDNVGARLIHISTDCVFSGNKGNYNETDIKDADDVYGRSKALGEIINNKDLTIRTSIIGPEIKEQGEGLFHWFMNQVGDINGYELAIWGGVTTLELAKAIDCAIDCNTVGLVHLSNGVGISKFDLLNLFKNIWNRNDINIIPYGGVKIDKSIAKSAVFDYEVSSYQQMLKDQNAWMQVHDHLYVKLYKQ